MFSLVKKIRYYAKWVSIMNYDDYPKDFCFEKKNIYKERESEREREREIFKKWFQKFRISAITGRPR